MRTVIATLLAAATIIGCDALVGGECLPNYQPEGGYCVLQLDSPSGGMAGEAGNANGGDSTGGAPAGGGGQGGGPGGAGQGGAGQGGAGQGGAVSGPGGGGTGGGVVCADGLVSCPDGCVDTTSDPHNCGQCDLSCPSELCSNSQCEGPPVGHVVLLGMNFAESSAATRRVLGNAAFVPIGNPVRVLAYTGHANLDHAAAVTDVLQEQAAIRGRQVSVTATTSTSAVANLDHANYDVFIMNDQPDASPGWGASFVQSTGPAIGALTEAGGTVIVLAVSDEMVPFSNGLGVVNVTSLAPLNSPNLGNNAPTGVIGIGVSSPSLAKTTTRAFITTDSPGPTLSFVLIEQGDATRPVVLHHAVLN